MAEVWKPVVGFEAYYKVSNTGKVLSLRTGKLRKPVRCKNGYYTMFLCGDHFKICTTVHRIVATAFCEKPEGCNCVNHKDENKLNNNADNLEWCTQRYNLTYNGKDQCCCKPIVQMKDGQVIRVWKSAREAEKHFKTNYKNISAVCRGLRPRAGGYEWKFA